MRVWNWEVFFRSTTATKKTAIFYADQKFCKIGQIDRDYDEITGSFDGMNLKPDLLRGTYDSFDRRQGRENEESMRKGIDK